MTGDGIDNAASGAPAPRRRPRYSGTHPREFDQRYKELNPEAYPEVHEHVRAQGRTPAGTHVPVLLDEIMAALRPQPGACVADCTIGYGGHAEEFLRRIGPTGTLVGLDVDAAQLERTASRLRSLDLLCDDAAEASPMPSGGSRATIHLHRSHFAGLAKLLPRGGRSGFDVVFADLGVSSMQIDDPARGFSYKHDGPLDMRMDDRLPKTAADWIAEMSVIELSRQLAGLADEPNAERIAAAIVRRRAIEPIRRTRQLVNAIFEAIGLSQRAWRNRPERERGQLHPAARTFQALRMLVNDERAGLAQFLRIVPHCLSGGGRIGVISFHSGEDRAVAQAFADGARTGLYVSMAGEAIRPTSREVAANPRSRSALFRWAAKAADV